MDLSTQQIVSVDRLNDHLRNELSAVDTYTLALDSAEDPTLLGTLRQLRDNHHRRVSVLTSQLRTLGAKPAESGGVWGAFAKLVQAGADLFGDKAAIACLEQFEDRMLGIYDNDATAADGPTRRYVETTLLPEQRRTHELCRTLKFSMKHA